MPDEPASTPPPAAPAPAPAPKSPSEQDARTWNMYCHLSALAGLIGIPAGNVLGPLLVWQLKKAEIPSVELHGKAALNFQLTILIGVAGSFVVGMILLAVCIGFIFFILAAAIGIVGMVFAIIAGLKANEGKEYKYPYSLNLIK
jgi:uncharacterized Tic20 family protein